MNFPTWRILCEMLSCVETIMVGHVRRFYLLINYYYYYYCLMYRENNNNNNIERDGLQSETAPLARIAAERRWVFFFNSKKMCRHEPV